MLRLGIDPGKLYRATSICQDDLCCCDMALISFRLFRKNLGNWKDFFGQMVYRPPWQKISRTPMLLPHVHYRLYYSAPTVLNFHVYCFCSHTSNFMCTASAPTPTLPSSLFLHPHLSALPYCFCFQTCTHVFRTAAPKPDLQPLLLLLPLLYFYIHFQFCSHNWTCLVIPLLSQHLYLLSLMCSLPHLHFVYIASVPNTLTAL